MKQKVLIIHHIEEAFMGDFEYAWNRDPEKTLRKLMTHLKRSNYDKIIISTMEGFETGYPPLDALTDVTREHWWYGDEPQYMPDLEIIRNHNANYAGHEWLIVYDWIKELKGCQVAVCGGHRDECLLGLTTTLDHLGIKYRTIEQCVYGD